MKVADKIVVVTGGAHGIGQAMCERFARESAQNVVVADIDEEAACRVAEEIGGMAIRTDVSQESDMQSLVQRVMEKYGRIDLFCSNAGIMVSGGPETLDTDWERIWKINVMAHVYAARAVIPGMIERGGGYLLQTVSAAGLLTLLGTAPYSVTKHAGLGLAEWLAITYADRGIKVSALCPLGVKTEMLLGDDSNMAAFLSSWALEPEQVADSVVRGLESEHFLILPHPEVSEFFQRKAADYDRWIRGMQRLQATVTPPRNASSN